jgi:hypothetical protein
MPAKIMICKNCSEDFELLPNKPGFANVCPDCSAPKAAPAPQGVRLSVAEQQAARRVARKPMSPEAASRAMDRALLDMAHLLAALDPQFRRSAEALTGRRFNRYINQLDSIAKGGR